MWGIFCDLTKAFDCVDHTILLNKLHHYGIRGTCQRWFKSYLENRKQQVSTSSHNLETGISSRWETITSGVRQGSIRGPLLCIIYMNDLPYGLHQGAKPIVYADDTSVLLISKNDGKLKTELISALDYMIGWFTANGLALNMEETNIMKFTACQHQTETFQIEHLNKPVIGINSTKFLGIERDRGMTWKNHIQSLLPKLSSACYLIRKMY